MNIKTPKALLLLLLVLSLLPTTRTALACGPYAIASVFEFTKHPDFPLEDYARGNLGVLQPTYARSYLLAAYRHIDGTGLNQQEQAALLSLWRNRLDFTWDESGENWVEKWLAARKSVPGVGELGSGIDVYRSHAEPDEYGTYLNCHEDAFQNAVSTLQDRVKKYGANSPALNDWLSAQDQVFANCSAGETIPAPAAPDAAPLVRADREYQIAAANFYAARYDQAQQTFSAIARDQSSPWRTGALYLAARALLRKGSFSEGESRKEALSQAEGKLNEVLNDRSLNATHNNARRLLNLVRLRLYPEKQLTELAQLTLRKDAGENFGQEVWDYTILLDKFIGESTPDESNKFTEIPDIRKDDLTDWLLTFQYRGDDAFEHALQRWQKTSTDVWLVAAISKMRGSHPQLTPVLEAAAKVRRDSPAFATIAFHSVRLMLEAGRDADARKSLDAVLAPGKSSYPVSTLNRLYGQRMLTARNLDEFLRDAQRTPTAFSYNFDGRELPEDPKDLAKEAEVKPFLNGRKLFDRDATLLMNSRMPLALLKEAAMSKTLPEHLRREVAIATWVRSVLINDRETGSQIAPVLQSLAPELKGFLEAEPAAASPAAQNFPALYALLKFPGLQPYVDPGLGRMTPLAQIDSYRDNWWCEHESEMIAPLLNGVGESDSTELRKSVASTNVPPFFTDAQKISAANETKKLAALGTAPNYLARKAVEWANAIPGDPRLPEALHLAVRSTRYGCTNEQTGPLSKAAHAVLHKRFPRSPWTQKTPYWFKGS